MKRTLLTVAVVLGVPAVGAAQIVHGVFWYRGPAAPPPPPWFGTPWHPYPPPFVAPPRVVVVGNGFGGVPFQNPFAPGPWDAPPMPPGPVAPQRNPNAGLGIPVGARDGEFVIIRPKPDANAVAANPNVPPGVIVPMIDRIAPRPVPEPAPRVGPFAPPAPAPVNVERVEADPAREAARLVQLARAAFAAGEYGTAAGHLDRAIKAKPGDALPLFLKAQARFAAGRYADAVDAVRAGVALAPDWPRGDFDPKALYGPNPERFAAHLATLKQTVAEHPDQPGLEFLLGYQLWFTGEREAAGVLFRAAARRAPGNAAIAAFAAAGEKR